MDNKFKVFVVIALVILAVIAGTSTFIALNVLNKTNSQAQESASNGQAVQSENVAVVQLKEAITSNIVDEASNPHVVRIVVAFEVNSEGKEYKKFSETFSEKEVIIRDNIINTLRQQTYEMMMREDAQEKLSDEIVANVNKLLGTTLIQKVYFGDFFVQ